MIIEPLESRIAPAAVTLAYTDIDGDMVKITDSSGTLTVGELSFIGGGANGQLSLLALTAAGFAGKGANLTFTVTKAAGGDGLADVGYINGDGNDFGSIKIAGDLGGMIIGSGSDTTPAVKTLAARSLGARGLSTQDGVGDLRLTIKGALGSLKVAGDIHEAIIDVTTAAATNAKIGNVSIGGSLIGGDADQSGSLIARDGLGRVTIKGDIVGGKGATSGAVTCTHDVAGVTVGGSLRGGSGFTSGVIFSALGAMGPVKIGGDVTGGTETFTGRIFGKTMLSSVKVGGSLLGGSAAESGKIQCDGAAGTISVARDVRGGSALNTGLIQSGGSLDHVTIGGSLLGGTRGKSGNVTADGVLGTVKIGRDVHGGDEAAGNSATIEGKGGINSLSIGGSLFGGTAAASGQILSNGTIASITIARDLRGGDGPGNGFGDFAGFIRADRIGSLLIGGSIFAGIQPDSTSAKNGCGWIEVVHDIGSLTVRGSILGAVGNQGLRSGVIISAGGDNAGTVGMDVAIGKLRVGGDVSQARILAGWSPDNNGFPRPTDGNAQVGSVSVSGDWIASSLVAGTANSSLNDFGDGTDTVITGGTIASIASITIKGIVAGSAAASDHFGFVSHTIGACKAAGFTATLHATGPLDGIELSPLTDDVTIREV